MSKPPRRFRTEFVKTTYGWSRWVQPNMKSYWLKCCDCGLVHEMQFRIGANADGTKQGVMFRARRARP